MPPIFRKLLQQILPCASVQIQKLFFARSSNAKNFKISGYLLDKRTELSVKRSCLLKSSERKTYWPNLYYLKYTQELSEFRLTQYECKM